MRLDEAIQLIEQSSAKELASLTRDEFMFIVAGMSPEDIQNFMFAKNIKIFGGINPYIDDFFMKETVEKTLQFPKEQQAGTVAVLKKMQTIEGVSKKNKTRLEKALKDLGAAGGRRRKTRRNRTRRQRGGNKQVVHCLTQLKRFAPCVETNPLRAYQFFYNLGRIQELVGDTEHPELWWKPIEALVAAKKYDQLSAHVDTLKERLGLEYDEPTLSKGC
jgi:hypothetical protein